MRAVKMFFTGSVAAVAVAIVACGGSSDAPPGKTTDAGTADDGSAASEDANDANVNLFTATPVDAALNDAGASVGTCIACAQTTCEKQVAACNDDVACDSTFACAFNCLGEVGGTLAGCYIQCGGSLSGANVDPVETALGQCALKSCATECAVCSISPKLCATPTDAGTPVTDASSDLDSPADGSSDATAE